MKKQICKILYVFFTLTTNIIIGMDSSSNKKIVVNIEQSSEHQQQLRHLTKQQHQIAQQRQHFSNIQKLKLVTIATALAAGACSWHKAHSPEIVTRSGEINGWKASTIKYGSMTLIAIMTTYATKLVTKAFSAQATLDAVESRIAAAESHTDQAAHQIAKLQPDIQTLQEQNLELQNHCADLVGQTARIDERSKHMLQLEEQQAVLYQQRIKNLELQNKLLWEMLPSSKKEKLQQIEGLATKKTGVFSKFF